MSYTEITFQDKNPLKRWLQRQRLLLAVELLGSPAVFPGLICDFGAGSGELCKLLRDRYCDSGIICYEPAQNLLEEARQNLARTPGVSFAETISPAWNDAVDVVFCLEVLEHLPPAETENAICAIFQILKPGGKLIVGVPVEVGIPALYKGFYRMAQRFVRSDADLKNVNLKNTMLSFLGFASRNRTVHEIVPGLNFYFEHTGFDYRVLKGSIEQFFYLVKVARCPFPFLGSWFMPEIYFVAEKAERLADDECGAASPSVTETS